MLANNRIAQRRHPCFCWSKLSTLTRRWASSKRLQIKHGAAAAVVYVCDCQQQRLPLVSLCMYACIHLPRLGSARSIFRNVKIERAKAAQQLCLSTVTTQIEHRSSHVG